ncbi:hypothetical protein HPB51_014960 [Rhipicephalus microplus]|uniref:F-box domain-containing protein n=1 Tax=Rhipicephalus microplus TaxID=6941 RepID=A0A9J6E2P3_RHIMP|nr:hypothetical protein HPB51_014960 [Rhipicephalus microplus]
METLCRRLPSVVSIEIFRHLDIESLLNLAEAVPECKWLAFSPTVVRNVHFDQGADAAAIEKFLQATRGELVSEECVENDKLAAHVRELRMTNCVALSSSAILECAEGCQNLRELHLVNCLVDPVKLFHLLCQLASVKKLEWSLHHEYFYKPWLHSRSADGIEIVPKLEGPTLSVMYVEYEPSDVTISLMETFVTRCPRLHHLHVHLVRHAHSGAALIVDCCKNFVPDTKYGPAAIIDNIPSLETFKYTCEMPLSLQMRTRLPVIQNNIYWQRKPTPSFNVASLDDVLKQKAVTEPFEQLLVTEEVSSQSARLLEAAAAKAELWKDTKRLTLVLKPLRKTDVPISPATNSAHEKPLERFFRTCVPQLTELNLSTSHFELGTDCSFLVASTLHKLRSLTLPPCGANLKNCLEHLARGCRLLERLEVRSTPTVEWAAPCEACKLPLSFTASCFELLHRETRLRRLIIDETARIQNLTFLIGCRVDEMQLSLDNVDEAELEARRKDLGRLLAANPRLCSLTLRDRTVTLGADLADTLSEVRSLRHLCVITANTNGSYRMVQRLFRRPGGLLTTPADGSRAPHVSIGLCAV